MRITLTHPPLDDPTLPYHSNAYLMGHLVHNGFTDASMRDINIEFVNYCLEERNVEHFYDEGERRLRDFGRRDTLSFREQEEFYGLWTANRIDGQSLLRVPWRAFISVRDSELQTHDPRQILHLQPARLV